MNVLKNNNEITQMRNRNYATEYLNLIINRKLTKTDFCNCNQISINSLNKGLESLGVKIKSKKTNKITVEEDLKTFKPLVTTTEKTRKSKIKLTDEKNKMKGGNNNNTSNEEADDLINNALNIF
ncbi:hypothetical protein BDFB_014394 [Asbolus verrucosus]|uniref:Uncharacterized protein n=1 Tax=Asbolus verrucosus TaxID=1661398 RepID=A0A482VY18_ASBVE|nr:hypothetical protein BDFB_014394 [Asbolus verrucosus]